MVVQDKVNILDSIFSRLASNATQTLYTTNEQPRTVAYHRLGAGMNITLRTDIAQDLDYMILNIRREGASWPPITLINIYNQKSPNPTTGSAQEWTAD